MALEEEFGVSIPMRMPRASRPSVIAVSYIQANA